MATLSLIFSVLGAWMVFLLLGFTKLSYFSKPGCDYTDQYCKFLIQAQSIPVGEIFGAFLFCFLAEIFGRKYIVLTLFIPIIVYSALIEFSYDSKNFIFASYARAISYGGALTILPVYLGEISEKQSRGKIISSVFALHIIGKYLQALTKSIFIVAGISVVHYGSIVLSILTGIVFAVFTRDTPSFFIQRKQPQLAKESLRDIRNANVDIDHELEQLMGKRVSTENVEGTVMLCLESNGCLKAFIIMMSLLGFKILTGDYTLLLFIASPFNTTQHLSYVYILLGYILQLLLSFANRLYALYVIMNIDLIKSHTFLSLTSFIGNISGVTLFCFLSEVIGRKRTLIGIFLTLIVSFQTGLFIKYYKNYILLCVVGITKGMSFGGAYTVLPIYISEISEKFSRGMFISLSQSIYILADVMIGNVIPHVDTDLISDVINYMSILLSLLTITAFGFLANESPLYYIGKGRDRSAQIASTDLRSIHDDTQLELDDLQNTTEDRIDNRRHNEKIMTCLKSNGFMKGVVIMISLIILQALCGVHVLRTYLFVLHDVSPSLKIYMSWLIGGVDFLSSLVCAFAVDRLGRKRCLLISFAGMAVSLIYFFVIKALLSNNVISESPFLYVLVLILFKGLYNFGAGPIPSIFITEIFSLKTKMLMSAVIAYIFAALQIAMYKGVLLYISSDICLCINIISCFIAVIVNHFLYLETSKKTFDEIQLALKRF
ncbi:glucose transporter GlcP-like [Diorhabda sublineata]|uniref:glucose transporter GlcP-like n=1 Tax=Diorhabda sublineata TaxID=1163346 RepID=UPI0024E0FB14|nr:glucose transporter GlcP-like [Diorhabda sublineata]